jgi:hypothetical protein
MKETESQKRRRRWINLGELIALGALIVSAFGVWLTWKGNGDSKPSTIVEQRQSIPLTLRGKAEDGGKSLQISPVESSHALESLTVTAKGASPVELGSDGSLDADSLEAALKQRNDDSKGTHSIPLRIEARYVELGKDKRASGTYRLTYRWEGGGLFGGRSLRLVALSRG